MAKLGVAVVGVGTMGKQHAFNLRRLIPEARLVAVVDADLKRAEQVAAELEIEHAFNRSRPWLSAKTCRQLWW